MYVVSQTIFTIKHSTCIFPPRAGPGTGTGSYNHHVQSYRNQRYHQIATNLQVFFHVRQLPSFLYRHLNIVTKVLAIFFIDAPNAFASPFASTLTLLVLSKPNACNALALLLLDASYRRLTSQ